MCVHLKVELPLTDGLKALLNKCECAFLASIFILKYEKREQIDQKANLCPEVKEKLNCISGTIILQNKGVSKIQIHQDF